MRSAVRQRPDLVIVFEHGKLVFQHGFAARIDEIGFRLHALDAVFKEIDAIEETNRRAEAGRRAMRTRFGVIDGYQINRAQAHKTEQRA